MLIYIHIALLRENTIGTDKPQITKPGHTPT